MKGWTLAALCAGLTVAATPMQAQEEGMPSHDAMMAAYAAAAAPGPHHETMATMAGKYVAKVTSWMDPSAPPMESKGTATFKMILGGRYLVQEYSGSMMGQQFEGLGISAYDKTEKKIVDVWIDNMGTGVLVMKGNFDESGKVLTTSGDAIDPVSGEPISYRAVTTMVSDTEHRFQMYITQGDHEMKALEITYTKAK